MSAPTTKLPRWATDSVFTSGPDTALSCRSEPSEAVKAQGYVADQAIAARVDNWRAGAVGDWLTALAKSPLRTWSQYISNLDTTESGPASAVLCGVPMRGANTVWFVPGGTGITNDTATVFFTPSSDHFAEIQPADAAVAVTGACSITSFAEGSNGDIICGLMPNLALTMVLVGYVYLDQINTIVLTTDYQALTTVVIEPVTGKRFTFDISANGWATSKRYWHWTSGALWTQHSLGAVTTRTIEHVAAAGGMVLLTFVDSDQVAVMSDPESPESWTWETVTDCTAVSGIAYTTSGWVVTGLYSGGGMYLWRRSGSTWTRDTSQQLTGLVDMTGYAPSTTPLGNMLASNNDQILVAPTYLTGMGQSMGVWFSVDAGVTWEHRQIAGAKSGGHGIKSVAYGHDEFLITCTGADAAGLPAVHYEVWHSGRL